MKPPGMISACRCEDPRPPQATVSTAPATQSVRLVLVPRADHRCRSRFHVGCWVPTPAFSRARWQGIKVTAGEVCGPSRIQVHRCRENSQADLHEFACALSSLLPPARAVVGRFVTAGRAVRASPHLPCLWQVMRLGSHTHAYLVATRSSDRQHTDVRRVWVGEVPA